MQFLWHEQRSVSYSPTNWLLSCLCRRNGRTYWECSVRRRNNFCPATVIQFDGRFVKGGGDHTHEPVINIETAVNIRSEVRSKARDDVFVAASTIAVDALKKSLSPSPMWRLTASHEHGSLMFAHSLKEMLLEVPHKMHQSYNIANL